jgi:hypothetical protein
MSTIAPTVSCGSPNGAGFVAVRKPFPRGRHIGDPIHAEPEGGGKQVAVEADVKNLVKDASDLYARILDGLELARGETPHTGKGSDRVHEKIRVALQGRRRGPRERPRSPCQDKTTIGLVVRNDRGIEHATPHPFGGGMKCVEYLASTASADL